MWRSFEVVKEALALVRKISDQLAEGKAGEVKKVHKFNFLFPIILMRVIIKKTNVLTVAMQKHELNVYVYDTQLYEQIEAVVM